MSKECDRLGTQKNIISANIHIFRLCFLIPLLIRVFCLQSQRIVRKVTEFCFIFKGQHQGFKFCANIEHWKIRPLHLTRWRRGMRCETIILNQKPLTSNPLNSYVLYKNSVLGMVNASHRMCGSKTKSYHCLLKCCLYMVWDTRQDNILYHLSFGDLIYDVCSVWIRFKGILKYYNIYSYYSNILFLLFQWNFIHWIVDSIFCNIIFRQVKSLRQNSIHEFRNFVLDPSLTCWPKNASIYSRWMVRASELINHC